MLAEAKAEVVHSLARLGLEGVYGRLKPVTFEIKAGATLERAKTQVFQKGNSPETVNQFFSVFQLAPNIRDRADALVGLTQGLIDLGAFQKARVILDEAPKFHPYLFNNDYFLFCAQVKEKEGWVEDAELGFFNSQKCFSDAADILHRISSTEWKRPEKECFSTTRHFLGRAHYGLAALGIDTNWNIEEAIGYFEAALRLDVEFPESAALKTGFGHGWLSRCYMLRKDWERADRELECMRSDFTRQLQITPGRGIMAQYHLLKGVRLLQQGAVTDAEDCFHESLYIRTNHERIDYELYPTGEANAYAGMVSVSLRKGEYNDAARYLLKAARTQPVAVFRGAFGG